MEAAQETIQKSERKAQRLNPSDEFTPEEFESIDEDKAALIRSGRVQFWRINGTVGTFTESVVPGVWQLMAHFADQSRSDLDEELKAVVSAFWDAEKPEYITAACNANWPNTCLMQSAGFRQYGVLPLSVGPVPVWGWRKCH